jgi:hypothetical protein
MCLPSLGDGGGFLPGDGDLIVYNGFIVGDGDLNVVF